MTLHEFYRSSVRPLPPDALNTPDVLPIDDSNEWTDEDLADMAAYAARHAVATGPAAEADDARPR